MDEQNRRHDVRYTLQPMYTAIVVHRIRRGEDGFYVQKLEGHAYDLSASGVRIELDEPLVNGERVSLFLALPGETSEIFVSGTVIWVNDDADDPGPRRAALHFHDFLSEDDRSRLMRYLRTGAHRQAA